MKPRSTCRMLARGVLVPLVAATLIAAATSGAGAAPPPFARKIGVELDGLGDGSRERPFVDLALTLRPWTRAGAADPAPTDAHGWPTADAQTVLFDIRPIPAWNPPIDDPAAFQPDWSGAYRFSFRGQATVRCTDDRRCSVEELRYNAARNVTTGTLTVPPGIGVCVLSFTDTHRTASGPAGTGITDLHVFRPDTPPGIREAFTQPFLDSLAPFTVLRYMDWLDTNHNPGYYGDAGHHALNWSDRRLPGEGTQQSVGGKYGVAWEYVIALANRTGKDLWINIPVAATDDYVLQLARTLKQGLRRHQNIYIEDSNEVWNYGFPQYIYNKLAAVDEVKRGGSALNNDGATDQEVWARRRHAMRLVGIAKTFQSVFGEANASAPASRIRPVYASWSIYPDAYFGDVLKWVNATYGPPRRFFYGVADAAYYNIDGAPKNATVPQLIAAMRASSDASRANRLAIGRIASVYGLRHCQYEIGPDTGGGKTDNVANRILANRSPLITEVIEHDARDNWFRNGGDLYMYFSHCSAYSRYGCWGLSEDIVNRTTPKWQAIYALTGTHP